MHVISNILPHTIGTVERDVEWLLEEHLLVADVKYSVTENANPDLSDSEFIEREDASEPYLQGPSSLSSRRLRSQRRPPFSTHKSQSV